MNISTSSVLEPPAPNSSTNFAGLPSPKLPSDERQSQSQSKWVRAPFIAAWILCSSGTPIQATELSKDLNGVSTASRYSINSGKLLASEVHDAQVVADSAVITDWFGANSDGRSYGPAGASRLSRAVDAVTSLTDNWDGDGGAAPHAYVASDLRMLAEAIGNTSRDPEIEVDSDGTVSLRWSTDEQTLALTLHGNGKVIGTMYPRTELFPLELSVRDRSAIAQFMSHDEVKSSIL